MIKYSLIVLVALVGFGPLAGCRKKKETIAKIYVRDASNQAVSGATVRLYGEPTDVSQGGSLSPVTLDMTTTSNSSGVAVFNFDEVYQLGQAGVVVANIEAKKSGQQGDGIIKVEQETTSEETVFI